MADEVHVHNPTPPSNGGGGGAGWIVALLVVIVLALVVWLFFLRGGDSGVPEQVDVDVNVPSPTAPN